MSQDPFLIEFEVHRNIYIYLYTYILKAELKLWNKILKNEEDFNAYSLCKLELENIYDKKVEGAKIRNKCEWYQHEKKPDKVLFES